MSSDRQRMVSSFVCFILCVLPLVFFTVLCTSLYYWSDPSLLNPYAKRMHMACGKGDTKAVQSMIQQGADVNAPVWEDTTALMWASCCGHLDTVKVLLAAGADANAQSGHGSVMAFANTGQKNAAKIVSLLKLAGAKE